MMEDFSEYNGEGTDLRRAQMRMLDILTEIDKVCRRHDIPYWLDFGTLLGAVRHKGFIPWDDDLDVTIFRDDNKRLQDFLARELPEQYYVFSERTSRKFDKTGYFRIVDRKSSVLRTGQDESAFNVEGNGIWVDIFNVERGNVPFKRTMDKYHGRAMRRIRGMINDGPVKLAASYVMLPFTSAIVFGYRMLQRVKGNENYVYNIPNCVVWQMFSQRRREQILPLREMSFEGRNFHVPNDSDAFLKETYGDYMTVPPKEKRVFHSVLIKIKDDE